MEASKNATIKKWITRVILIMILIGVIIFSIPRIKYSLSHVSTDDAYVHAGIVPISVQVDGKLTEVYVYDNQLVKKGDLLIKIEDNDYATNVEQKRQMLESSKGSLIEIESAIKEMQRHLEQANAELQIARAQEILAEKEEIRYRKLLKEDLVAQSDYDKSKSTLDVNIAQIKASIASISQIKAEIETLYSKINTQKAVIRQNEANLELALIDLERTYIYSPVYGRVAEQNRRVGEYVEKGDTLFSIVDLNNIWVEANFKETQIEKMRIGQKVEIDADAWPNFTYIGHISSFRPGSGAIFSLLPPEDATGNFVKVVRRVPVNIEIDTPFNPNAPLWPGLSVIPVVDLTSKGKKHLEEGHASYQ